MSEHTEQSALFEWAAWHVGKAPELKLLFAIPNGGARDAITGARMKREGQKAGVWDMLLPIARNGFHGLWIEMKVGANNLTPAQEAWGAAMLKQGYFCEVCYSWQAAARVLIDYLGLNARLFGVEEMK